MGRIAVLTGSLLFVFAIQFGVNGQETKVKSAPPAKAVAQPAPKPAAPPTAKPTVPPNKELGSEKPNRVETQPKEESTAPSADEVAIRQTGKTYVTEFNQRNAKAVAAHYTVDAEYIDENGGLTQGRPVIEESLKDFFANNPECTIDLNIMSIRFVGPGVAIEDGTTTVLRSKNSEPVTSRYTAVQLKSDGKWLTASVRDSAIPPQRQHRVQLRQLEWMLGEWVHEGNDAIVIFNCRTVDNGAFLIRDFKIQIAGQDAMSGSQRIGWDAQAGRLKAWIFDSDGGHSEGYWHRDGDTWVLKVHGVTADGQTASSTSVYSFVNPHTMTFQSVDHEVAGHEMPDSAKVKIVRHPPRPE